MAFLSILLPGRMALRARAPQTPPTVRSSSCLGVGSDCTSNSLLVTLVSLRALSLCRSHYDALISKGMPVQLVSDYLRLLRLPLSSPAPSPGTLER